MRFHGAGRQINIHRERSSNTKRFVIRTVGPALPHPNRNNSLVFGKRKRKKTSNAVQNASGTIYIDRYNRHNDGIIYQHSTDGRTNLQIMFFQVFLFSLVINMRNIVNERFSTP